MRDFTLDLETNSPQDYLDKNLEDVANDQVQTEKDLMIVKGKNKLRKQIKNCFKNRTCLAFGRPANDEETIKRLDDEDKIKPEFKSDVDHLMKLLTLSILPKSANKRFLTGTVFFKFLDELVKSLNSGETPMLSSAVERLLSSETEQKTRKILASCNIALDAFRERLPMAPAELAKKVSETLFDYLENLREGIAFMTSKDVYAKQSKLFLKNAKEKMAELEAANRVLIKEKTSNLIASFEAALPPATGVTGVEFKDFAASLKPLYNTYFGTTTSHETLDWPTLSQYLTESLFAQFEGAAASATDAFASQQAEAEASIQELRDSNRRLKSTIAELEAGLDEIRRGHEIEKERAEDSVVDAKDVEIKMLRDRLAKLEAKYEKEKESQSNYKKVD